MATKIEIHKNKLLKNITKQETMFRKYLDITDQELRNKSIEMRMSQQTIKVRRSIARQMFGYDSKGRHTGINMFDTYKKSLNSARKAESINKYNNLFDKGTMKGFMEGYTGSNNINAWVEPVTEKLDLIAFTIFHRAKERGKSRDDYKALYDYIQNIKQQVKNDIINKMKDQQFTYEEILSLKELLQQKYEGAKLKDEDYVTSQMTTDLVEIFKIVYSEDDANKYTDELMSLV